jgi:hypothetical protein
MRRARVPAVFLEYGREAVVIVVSDQAREIFLARKLDAVGPQNFGERA